MVSLFVCHGLISNELPDRPTDKITEDDNASRQDQKSKRFGHPSIQNRYKEKVDQKKSGGARKKILGRSHQRPPSYIGKDDRRRKAFVSTSLFGIFKISFIKI